MSGLPGKRRIRDQISAELLHDFDGFAVEETNWSGATGINVSAITDDDRRFWFRVEITKVWEESPPGEATSVEYEYISAPVPVFHPADRIVPAKVPPGLRASAIARAAIDPEDTQ